MDTTFAVQDEAKEPNTRDILQALERLRIFTQEGFSRFDARMERLETNPNPSVVNRTNMSIWTFWTKQS